MERISQPLLLGFSLLFMVLSLNAQNTISSDQIQTAWLKAFNNGEELSAFYDDQSGILLKNKLFAGQQKITSQFKLWREAIKGDLIYEKVETFQLRDQQKFEIGKYSSKKHTYYTVIGWRKGETWNKAFETIYKNKKVKKDELAEVDNGRQAWEDASNAHDLNKLVGEVCMPNGYYFNRGRTFVGEEIKEAYSYMNNPNWKIKLTNLTQIQVNKYTVFDIGKFNSGGEGLYVLIWRKEKDNWKVLLDFNF